MDYLACDYETALEMAKTCRTIGDLMILANYIEKYTPEKRATSIAERILHDCCYFVVSEMKPLPKKRSWFKWTKGR